jgi:hypothetical protein
VTLKENANEAELDKAKEQSKQQGGEIKHEFSLIKGFTYVPRLTIPTYPCHESTCSISSGHLIAPLCWRYGKDGYSACSKSKIDKWTSASTSILMFLYITLNCILRLTPLRNFSYSVEFPPDKVNALQTNEHIHVEQDGDVKTQ